MQQGGVERRRSRRVELQASLYLRLMDEERAPFQERQTRNVGLGGVYFETADSPAFAVNDAVMTSLAIPEPQRREFPFTRLLGASRVVRVTPLPHDRHTDSPARFGIALEFGDDMTALTAIPPR